MAYEFGGVSANMGPFKAVSLKGNAFVHGVPMFVDKLPLTIGGIAGENIPFGRVVSVSPDDRRKFVLGVKSGYVVKGISMLDPTILSLDPGQIDGQNHYYFSTRPMTATTLGILDILEWDTTQSAPAEGSTVWCRNDNGMLAFNDGTALGSDYTKLNAFVYETLDPNGAKVFFNLPLAEQKTVETLQSTAVPTATPAAGAVDTGTGVVLTSTTPNAKIYYTIDNTAPTMASQQYTGPIAITAAVTIKAIAVAEGSNPSTVLTAAYTLN